MQIKNRSDLFDLMRGEIDFALSNLHTSTIARVTKVNEKTINCKVIIPLDVDGELVQMPEFIKVPPIFMQGGGSYTAHPIKPGDYCLLVFTERCFDAWYGGSDDVEKPDFRMHDYSDGFAIVGVNPLEAAISIPEVITNIGDSYHEGDHEHKGDLEQDGSQKITGSNDAKDYKVDGEDGATGVFLDLNGKSVTVKSGIITSIV